MTNSLTKLDFHVDVDVNVNFFVGHHVGRHVSHHVGHRNVVSTLCEVSETLTEWKSKTITYVPIIKACICLFGIFSQLNKILSVPLFWVYR